MVNSDKPPTPEQDHLAEILVLATKPSTSRYKPVGYCLACYEDVTDPKLFCNNLCAEEHSHMVRLNRRMQ